MDLGSRSAGRAAGPRSVMPSFHPQGEGFALFRKILIGCIQFDNQLLVAIPSQPFCRKADQRGNFTEEVPETASLHVHWRKKMPRRGVAGALQRGRSQKIREPF
jgi:hypothetical protein